MRKILDFLKIFDFSRKSHENHENDQRERSDRNQEKSSIPFDSSIYNTPTSGYYIEIGRVLYIYIIPREWGIIYIYNTRGAGYYIYI